MLTLFAPCVLCSLGNPGERTPSRRGHTSPQTANSRLEEDSEDLKGVYDVSTR